VRQPATLDLLVVSHHPPPSSLIRSSDPLHALSRTSPTPLPSTTSTTTNREENDRAPFLSPSLSFSPSPRSDYPAPATIPIPVLSIGPNLNPHHPSFTTLLPPPSPTASYPFAFTPRCDLLVAHLRLLTTFALGSVRAPPCQFLYEATDSAVRYLPIWPLGWLTIYATRTR